MTTRLGVDVVAKAIRNLQRSNDVSTEDFANVICDLFSYEECKKLSTKILEFTEKKETQRLFQEKFKNLPIHFVENRYTFMRELNKDKKPEELRYRSQLIRTRYSRKPFSKDNLNPEVIKSVEHAIAPLDYEGYLVKGKQTYEIIGYKLETEKQKDARLRRMRNTLSRKERKIAQLQRELARLQGEQ